MFEAFVEANLWRGFLDVMTVCRGNIWEMVPRW
jgi:hypothetical protein